MKASAGQARTLSGAPRPMKVATAADVALIERRPYREFMPHGSVHAALAAAAGRHAARPALSFIVSADIERPPQRWTHAQLLGDITRAANLFGQLEPEPRIAMLLPSIPQTWFALWGGETAGVVCPINYLLSAEHIADLVAASGANILVALGPNDELDIWSRVATLRARCPRLRHVLAVGGAARDALDFDAALREQPGDALRVVRGTGSGDIAALFHTGGTTGSPKLAQHTHGNQLHVGAGAALMYASTEHDTVLNGFPLFHVAGSMVYGLSALLAGGEVVLPTLTGLRNVAFMKQYWRFVERHRVTLLAAVPTVMATLLGLPAPTPAQKSSVRACYTGGSPLPNELALAFEQKLSMPVRNILGMTECAGVISIEPFAAPRTPGSCGLPLPFTEVQAGSDGVLRVRGPNVGPGYTEAARNAGTFTDDGWLVSGDIGHVDAEGRVFVTGRAKDVIIRGGHNIDPGTIEEALLQHPDVALAAAIGEPDEIAGELPVAFVVLRPGAQADETELLAFAAARVHERPAAPKRITVLTALPLTAIGKVYKPALRLQATLRVLQARLEAAHLAERLTVQGQESSRGVSVRFVAAPGESSQALDAVLRPLMARFAIEWCLG